MSFMWETSFGVTRLKGTEGPDKLVSHDWGYRLRRISAELKVREGSTMPVSRPIVQARLLLCDFRATWIGLFTETPLEPGTGVALTIEEPKQFFCYGTVVNCNLVTLNSKVISTQHFDYRIAVQILFRSKEEFFNIRQYSQELKGKGQPTVISSAPILRFPDSPDSSGIEMPQLELVKAA